MSTTPFELTTQDAVKSGGTGFEIKVKSVLGADGQAKPFNLARLKEILFEACRGYETIVSPDMLLKETSKNLFDGMQEKKVMEAAIMGTRSFIEHDPAFSFVTARLLLQSLYEEVVGHTVTLASRKVMYMDYLPQYLLTGIEAGRLDARLKTDFDLTQIAEALDPSGDDQFTFLGLQTLYDRYFIHVENRRIELPQLFWLSKYAGGMLPASHLRVIGFPLAKRPSTVIPLWVRSMRSFTSITPFSQPSALAEKDLPLSKTLLRSAKEQVLAWAENPNPQSETKAKMFANACERVMPLK